jgi:glycosyltransferase involved in cell wall biosynthesis
MATSKIHVGIDATSWSNGRGFGRFTRALVTALAARDSEFKYTLVFDQPTNFDIPPGVDTLNAATESSLNESAVGDTSRSRAYLWKIGQLVRQTGFDIFFYPAVYSYFPLLARVPCVVCYHDATAERIPHLLFPTKLNHRLWQLKTALAKLQTSRAMTISQSSATDLENILKIPKRKIDLVTEGADKMFRVLDDPALLASARAKYQIPADAEVLLALGGMNAHKNILGMLRAMPAIVEKHPEVHLVIIGDTSGKGFWDNVPELMTFVETHPPLPDHVYFTGYADDEDVVALLNGAAALVFPSLWEGFGLPAVEAMACGVPVLSSDKGSLPEVIGDAGLFYDPLDIDDIIKTVQRFFEEPGLRQQLTTAAVPRSQLFS